MTEFAPNNFGDDGINRKTILRHHHVRDGSGATATEQRVADEFDDFVRAVAEDEVGRFNAEFGGEFLFEIKCVAVGIQIHAGERLLHGGQRERRRPERIFVRRELDDAAAGRPSSRATSSIGRPG